MNKKKLAASLKRQERKKRKQADEMAQQFIANFDAALDPVLDKEDLADDVHWLIRDAMAGGGEEPALDSPLATVTPIASVKAGRLPDYGHEEELGIRLTPKFLELLGLAK